MSLKFKQIKLTTSGLSKGDWSVAQVSEKITDGKYKDSQILISPQLVEGQCYFLAGAIYRKDTVQKIKIKLINGEKEQYIRTIEVAVGTGYEEFNLMFTPMDNFSTIVYEMVRNASDIGKERPVIIATTELSLVNTDTQFTVPAIQVGIHAPSGTLLCVNKQPIIIGKSGVLEIKNGFLAINFLTAIAPRVVSIPNSASTSTCLIREEYTRIELPSPIIVDYTYEEEGV